MRNPELGNCYAGLAVVHEDGELTYAGVTIDCQCETCAGKGYKMVRDESALKLTQPLVESESERARLSGKPQICHVEAGVQGKGYVGCAEHNNRNQRKRDLPVLREVLLDLGKYDPKLVALDRKIRELDAKRVKKLW
jgi:hypothetical protein